MISLRSRRSAPALDWQEYLGLVTDQANGFAFGGNTYGLNTTWGSSKVDDVDGHFPGYMTALQACPPAFAAQLVRAQVLSQARFTWRRSRSAKDRPGKLFGSQALAPLERPWPNGTTSELVSKLEWHAGIAGNAYVWADRNRLRILRPDWVQIVLGSQAEPDDPDGAVDAELLGYRYCNGGFGSRNKPVTLLPEEVAHWSPLPDPLASWRGMSWLTPALREIQSDRAITQHKLKFFENAATPNLVVKGLKAKSPEAFAELVEKLEERHRGIRNHSKTLYLGEGGDASVVGSTLKDLDLRGVQGGVETRISMLSRVPAPVLQIAEGAKGSALSADIHGPARRNFGDTWLYPHLQSLCASLATVVAVPNDAELWFDTAEIPFLREDAKDQAEILEHQLAAISSGITAGFDPASVVDAVAAKDLSKLVHTGLVSVQLQEPGTQKSTTTPG